MNSESSTNIGILSRSEHVTSFLAQRLKAGDIPDVHFPHSTLNTQLSSKYSDLDVLLIDLDNPDLDHKILLPQLHSEFPLLKVIVISSDDDPRLVRFAMNNGVFDYIPKPLVKDDVDQTLQNVISAARQLKKNVSDHDQIMSIEHELDVARQIQSSIIPRNVSSDLPGGYLISGRNQVSEKVGGDFFDYFTLSLDQVGFVIGDVASKGIPAAIFMAFSRTLFKSIALTGTDPATCLKNLNRILVMESDPSMFIAILYGILDTRTGDIAYANGGHTHPMLVHSDGTIQFLDHAGNMVLGVIEDAEYQLFHTQLSPGDIFFTATDGIGEITDMHGKPVGDHFVKRNLIQHRMLHPDQILDKIYNAVWQIHPNGKSLNDDITCMLLKFVQEPK